MTLLAFGIVGALAAITAALHSVALASTTSRAALLAQQVVAQLERGTTLTAGTQSGTFDNLDANAPGAVAAATAQTSSADSLTTDFTWSAEVGSADSSGLYPVTITIKWPPNATQYQLYTLLRPQALQSKPAAPTGGGAGGGGGTSGGGTGGGGTPPTPRPGGGA